jgi:hypothetical protein
MPGGAPEGHGSLNFLSFMAAIPVDVVAVGVSHLQRSSCLRSARPFRITES